MDHYQMSQIGKDGDDHPHLERCPDENVYHTQKQVDR